MRRPKCSSNDGVMALPDLLGAGMSAPRGQGPMSALPESAMTKSGACAHPILQLPVSMGAVPICPDGQMISCLSLKVVNGGAKLVHPGGAKLVHLTLCGTRCWGVVPVVHRRDPRCFE